MTEAEKVICKMYLNDLDKTHSCNEYKLLMRLLEQEPCEDCISRADITYKIDCIEMTGDETWMDFYRKVLDILAHEKSVTPLRPKGEWIDDMPFLHRCSKCNATCNDRLFKENLNYCPNCGAKMKDSNSRPELLKEGMGE